MNVSVPVKIAAAIFATYLISSGYVLATGTKSLTQQIANEWEVATCKMI